MKVGTEEYAFVMYPTPKDIICGRGKIATRHPGNNWYRELIDNERLTFANASLREKKAIAKKTANIIKGEGRKFLKSMNNGQKWKVLSEEECLRKISQALRENQQKLSIGLFESVKTFAISEECTFSKSFEEVFHMEDKQGLFEMNDCQMSLDSFDREISSLPMIEGSRVGTSVTAPIQDDSTNGFFFTRKPSQFQSNYGNSNESIDFSVDMSDLDEAKSLSNSLSWNASCNVYRFMHKFFLKN